MKKSESLTYKEAGVDIDAGNAFIEDIKPIVKRTLRPEVLSGIGGFGAMFQLQLKQYETPVLVSGTDGVGTKVKLAIASARHDTIGIDLVAMCVNDIIVQGAEPLFFLDYYATSKLQRDIAVDVVKGIGAGCEMAGAALIGGETAEMPGMYQTEDYDLAGFCVGIVEKAKIITGEHVKCGDQLIALASSGPHSNGYSLIRKILEKVSCSEKIMSKLMIPTKIYVKSMLALQQKMEIKAIAHITGGGLSENLIRVLPDNVNAQVAKDSWQMPEIFQWIQAQGNVQTNEMFRTFNCGIGMVIIVASNKVDEALTLLADKDEKAWVLGQISERKGKPTVEIK